MTASGEIKEAQGPYHDFWLRREVEAAYEDFGPLSGRRDALVRIPMDVMDYLCETMRWFPTVNPAVSAAVHKERADYGLNFYGPTVINAMGGAAFGRICESWAQLFECGPKQIVLTNGLTSELDAEGNEGETRPYKFCVAREKIVQDLRLLAEWGRQTMTGEFYILHLGI